MNKPDTSIIERVLSHRATTEEIHLVLSWFKTDEGQQWLSSEMDRDLQSILLGEEEEQAARNIPSDRMYRKIVQKIRFQRIKRISFRAAALLIPFVLLIAGYMQVEKRIDFFAQTDYDEITVPTGEHMQLMFQDGSKVYLNSGSHIRYPKKFSFFERRVYLEGEAWFEVAKGESWPFIVDLNCLDVKVKGTTFNVKAYPGDNKVNVSLKEGKIDVELSKNRMVSLQPGEKAVYDRSTDKCTVETYDLADASNYDWRNNMLTFNNTPLEEVLKRLSQIYNIRFKMTDPHLYKYTYTLTSNEKDLNVILSELEKITPLQFKAQGDTIFVLRK